MAQLLVKLKSEIIQNIELDPSQEYIAGRGEDCNIVLNSGKGISRKHIKIFNQNSKWKVILISRVGDFTHDNEHKTELILESNTIFSIYPYDFHFEPSNAVSIINNSTGSADVSTSDQLDAQNSKEVVKHNTVISVGESTMTMAHSSQFIASVTFIDENGNDYETLEFKKDIIIAGRDTDNDIILNNKRISRKQFKITKVGSKYFIQDLNSVNGTFINGNKISPNEPSVLLSGDIISVLNFKLNFNLKDSDFDAKALQALNQLPIEPQEPINSNSLALVENGNPSNEVAPWIDNSNNYMQEYIPPQNQELYLNSPLNNDLQAPQQTSEDEAPSLNFWGLKIELNKQNKFRIGIVLIGLILTIFLGLESSNTSETEDKSKTEIVTDPFLKLSPEDQNYVKHTYSLAKNLYMQANYEIAQAELLKLHEKIDKYEDSRELENYVKIAIEDLKRKEENDRIEAEKRDLEDRLQNVVKHCSQFINKDMTADQLNECLAPALQINPEHPALIELKEQLNKIEEERRLRLEEQAQYEAQVKALKEQFEKALETVKKNQLKGIAALDEVMNSTLPDPEKLKEQAKRKKKSLMSDTEKKIKEAIAKSKSMAEGENYKDAILLLEKAQVLDPEDELIPEQIIIITNELKKKMQVLYQEAIVEENIGNVETAKERWKKIIELDVPAGEYYQKSKIKLKKYGAL